MTDAPSSARRRFLSAAGLSGALLLAGCASSGHGEEGGEKEVTANEDLMREHGVLRRALIVYDTAAGRLRRDPAAVSPDALARTASLFRTFGEDYHERRLEEPFIFPVVRRAGGPAAAYPDVLVAQHQRGREITAYVLEVTRRGRIGAADAEPMARALEAMVRMYEPHTAREDTIVFPAWKAALSETQYEEMGDKFEDIERQQFGHDGFEDAVREIGRIETALGIGDLATFTAPPPRR